MEITNIGLLACLLLLLLPLYAFWRFRVQRLRSTLIAVARMAVQLLVVGFYMDYLFEWNSWFINIVWLALMVCVSLLLVPSFVKLKFRVVVIPMAVSLFTTALIAGLLLLVVVLRLDNPFDARYFIPIMGMLLGVMVVVNAYGMVKFYESLRRDYSLYEYLLGNGATRMEAVAPFVRISLTSVSSWLIKVMAFMGLFFLPDALTGQILGGVMPNMAVKCEIAITVVTFSASVVSLVLSLLLSVKKSFDCHSRLKDISRLS